jgi:hypothetical protein
MNATEAISLAKEHQDKGSMVSSAKSCIADAEKCFNDGLDFYAMRWALESLKYSVGVFSPDYQKLSHHYQVLLSNTA